MCEIPLTDEQKIKAYDELLDHCTLMYANAQVLIMNQRTMNVSSKVYDALNAFTKRIDNSELITSEGIRFHQRPKYWPPYIREAISKNFEEKYGINGAKSSKQDIVRNNE